MIKLRQAAGHGQKQDGHGRILKDTKGHIMKPFQRPPKGFAEWNFYKEINQSEDEHAILLRKHIPKFYGVTEVEVGGVNGRKEKFLLLEDATCSMEIPNVMDIKIGKQTWAPDATAEKRILEDSKYVSIKIPYGFSVLGIIQHAITDCSVKNIEPVLYDKTFGKNLETNQVLSIPKIFFDVERTGVQINPLIRIFIKELKDILKVFREQRIYKFYASSLLLVYDVAAVRRYLDDGNQENLKRNIRVKLIDFAHVFPSNGEIDKNFIFGLDNLIKVFEKIL